MSKMDKWEIFAPKPRVGLILEKNNNKKLLKEKKSFEGKQKKKKKGKKKWTAHVLD